MNRTTPLSPDEADDLIPSHITLQAELDEFEQANILRGVQWASKTRGRKIPDTRFLKELHRKMFD